MAKLTLGLTKIPKGNGWTKLCTGKHLLQNTDTKNIYFVFSDAEPPIPVDKKDCHILKAEQDDNYINADGDTIWVKQDPYSTSSIVLTEDT